MAGHSRATTLDGGELNALTALVGDEGVDLGLVQRACAGDARAGGRARGDIQIVRSVQKPQALYTDEGNQTARPNELRRSLLAENALVQTL